MKRTYVLLAAMLWLLPLTQSAATSANAIAATSANAVAADCQKPLLVPEHIEPPFWWVGMETPLQLMLHGTGLGMGTVESTTPGLEVTAVHKADSPNYLFLDIRISSEARPGTYTLRWTEEGVSTGSEKQTLSRTRTQLRTLDIPYVLYEREPGSAQRQGLTPSDVLYLLMPDRYVNGDPANDNTPDTAEKSDTSKDYGRHGGDLEGIRMSLDYLAELGVTSVWPTPVTLDNEPIVSYHGYACADYYTIDPRFGTNEQYRNLVQEAAGKGITFLQDMVPNHCGTAHWWMQDLPFKDWIHVFDTFTRSNYAMSTHMDPYAAVADRNLCVDGWFDTSMPDMNLENPFVLQYFTQATVWWIEYAGLAGVRVDTYPYSDKDAMGAYSSALRKEYPHATVVAECWYNYPQQIAYWERGPLPGGPTVMDFPLAGEIFRALIQDTNLQWGDGMVRLYNLLSHDFVYDNPYELLIFGENHDTNRLYEQLGRNPEKLKMAYAFLATTRGIPQIYYGTEVLLCARDSRRLGHGEERVLMTDRVLTQEGRSGEEQDMYDYVSRLLSWRKTSEALQQGQLLHFLPTMEENTYVYFRIAGDERVMVVINNGTQPVALDWQRYAEGLGRAQKGRNVLSNDKVEVGKSHTVPAQTAQILSFDCK
jgi:glycosidase